MQYDYVGAERQKQSTDLLAMNSVLFVTITLALLGVFVPGGVVSVFLLVTSEFVASSMLSGIPLQLREWMGIFFQFPLWAGVIMAMSLMQGRVESLHAQDFTRLTYFVWGAMIFFLVCFGVFESAIGHEAVRWGSVFLSSIIGAVLTVQYFRYRRMLNAYYDQRVGDIREAHRKPLDRMSA